MTSLEFPKMFNTTNTRVVRAYREATLQNLKLFFNSEEGDLFGDPFYGICLKRYTYDQNNYVLRDILIDAVYSKVSIFFPQLTITRKDIKIKQEGARLILSLKAINNLDFTTNMYDIVLFHSEEER